MTARELPFSFAEVLAFLDHVVDAGPPGPPGPAGPPGPDLADVTADLAALDLPPGTAILLSLSNTRRLLQLYFGALLAGLVPMTVSPATGAARVAALGRQFGAGAVIAARLDPGRFGGDRTWPVGDTEAVLLGEPVRYPPGTVLMPTSGTSGMFSACLHRVDSLLRNARRHAAAVGLRAADTILVNLPLHYSYATVAQAMAALVTGARLVVSGPPFQPEAYRATITSHQVTSSSITPTIARLLLTGEAHLPTGLRTLTVGGDRMDPAHTAALLAANPALELFITYGLTEAGPRVATLAAHAEPAHRLGSVGLPLACVTVRLRDAAGQPDAAELIVASDTVMLAKLGGRAGQRDLIAPGVLATGDMFHLDEDGYLFFRGRLSDFVVLRGEKVSLYAVRQFVQSLPGVIRCATMLDHTEDPQYDLEVQVAEGAELAPRQIRQAMSGFLLPAERPRDIRIVQASTAAFQK